MAIKYVPSPGQVLMCDFESAGFVRPEMQKVRHCVVISPRYRREWGTCLIVPLSTQPPNKVLPHHFVIAPNKYRFFTPDTEIWAKANMLTHVGFPRLDRVMEDGVYCNRYLDRADFKGVMVAVLHAVGCSHFARNFVADSA
jgi:mRNA interferase MazF